MNSKLEHIIMDSCRHIQCRTKEFRVGNTDKHPMTITDVDTLSERITAIRAIKKEGLRAEIEAIDKHCTDDPIYAVVRKNVMIDVLSLSGGLTNGEWMTAHKGCDCMECISDAMNPPKEIQERFINNGEWAEEL